MNIAYVTYENVGKYTSTVEDEDALLLTYLIDKGIKIKEEIWTDEKVDWSIYSHALLKSPWDYFDKYPLFIGWLSKIETLGLKVLNPINIIKWNSDKHYLADIEKEGFRITPTSFLEKNSHPQLKSYFNLFNSEELVVKPTVSGGSKNTFKFNKINVLEIETVIHHLLKDEAFMIQPFITEIELEGEWSYLFFNGDFSHALLKKAKSGDFRVQHYLGGTIHPKLPSSKEIKIAQQYVNIFAKNCLYARVDGVYINNEFHLMELELIEPFLFLFTSPNSYQHYYNALVQLL